MQALTDDDRRLLATRRVELSDDSRVPAAGRSLSRLPRRDPTIDLAHADPQRLGSHRPAARRFAVLVAAPRAGANGSVRTRDNVPDARSDRFGPTARRLDASLVRRARRGFRSRRETVARSVDVPRDARPFGRRSRRCSARPRLREHGHALSVARRVALLVAARRQRHPVRDVRAMSVSALRKTWIAPGRTRSAGAVASRGRHALPPRARASRGGRHQREPRLRKSHSQPCRTGSPTRAIGSARAARRTADLRRPHAPSDRGRRANARRGRRDAARGNPSRTVPADPHGAVVRLRQRRVAATRDRERRAAHASSCAEKSIEWTRSRSPTGSPRS